jgi:hypothetical protein
MWAHKSGTPTDAEIEAMEKALAVLKKAGKDARIQIFPVRVNGKVDRAGAEQLASLLNETVEGRAQVAAENPNFDIQRNSNEQRVLWDMARAFRLYMKSNQAKTYSLYGDYMLSPRDGRVMAVHFAICDPKGEWVIVDFQNSHHEDFQSVDPKSVKDCNQLVAKRLKGYL